MYIEQQYQYHQSYVLSVVVLQYVLVRTEWQVLDHWGTARTHSTAVLLQ